MSHGCALPDDVRLLFDDEDPDEVRIRAGGAPDYIVVLSDGWFWWFRRVLDTWIENAK